MDDNQLTELGNMLRRFTQGGEQQLGFVGTIEDYLTTHARSDELYEDLIEPVASYRPEAGEHLDGPQTLSDVFAVALEEISARCGGIGAAYLTLIAGYLEGTVNAAEFVAAYWPLRRRYMDQGMWFEGRLGKEISTFDTDVNSLDDDYQPISEEAFRKRCAIVARELRRVLGRVVPTQQPGPRLKS
jgi:hypothetical protein